MSAALWLIVLPTQAEPSPSDVDALLAPIDALLAQAGGERAESDRSFCDLGGPAAENRQFLCERSEPAGRWLLTAPHAPSSISAHFSARRMSSPEAAREAVQIAAERYGAGEVGVPDGALSWCYAAVGWRGDLLWALDYGCHISHHVRWVHDLQAQLIAGADPFHGAAAIVGSHSGWSWLVDAAGAEIAIAP